MANLKFKALFELEDFAYTEVDWFRCKTYSNFMFSYRMAVSMPNLFHGIFVRPTVAATGRAILHYFQCIELKENTRV